ncbi:lytic transglycosylase catalytic subunit [Caballeronia udeis]|uniref:Lytic transglycosylase catalytic subunit n=1 Tax=Caballeronia udeis TaxID=1232866 RepID=A0A158H5Q3_9BURK|nr:glucosaminidase domain-containing protein [Caballeronia udeis]SAL39269.1 lytic transglycosylase catalytic subunit [Caballeronia udeis]
MADDLAQVSNADLLSSLPPSPQVFAALYAPVAQQVGQKIGVDPQLLLGQWGHESGWGAHIIPGTNNLGNIKDPNGKGPTATDNANGSKDSYAAYNTPQDFGNAYASLIQSRYPGAVGAGSDVSKFTKGLARYAEDPSYALRIAAAAKSVPTGAVSNAPAQPAIGQVSDADLMSSLNPTASAGNAPPTASTSTPAQSSLGQVSDADLMASLNLPVPPKGGVPSTVSTAASLSPGETDVTGQPAPPLTDRQKAAGAVQEALEGGPLNQFTHGIASGAANLVGGAGQLIAHGVGSALDYFNPPKQNLAGLITGQQPQSLGQKIAGAGDTAAQFLNQDTPNSVAGQVGRMVGAAALPLPGNGLVSGAAGGAAMGVAQPVLNNPTQNYWTQKAIQAGTGAAVGGAAGALGKVIGGANVSPEARALMDQGVTLTPGQALGGLAKSTESKLTSVPVVGDAVKSAQNNAIDQFNRVMYQNALAPIGQTLPKAVKTGSEGIDHVATQIGNVYQAIEPQVTFAPRGQFLQDLNSIRADLAQNSPASLDQFDSIVQNQIENKLQGTQGNGYLTGAQWGNTRSAINGIARNQRTGNATPDNRMLADALGDLNEAINNQVFRNSPPTVQPQLQQANSAWARYKQIESAAGGTGASNNGNVFTPAQLTAAIRRGSTAYQKATNSGLNADVAQSAQQVLGGGYPDSGTAGRSALIGIPVMMGELASHGHPAMAAGAGAGLLGGTAAYGTQAGRAAMLALLARRPDLLQQIGGGMGALAPQVGAAAVNGQNLGK